MQTLDPESDESDEWRDAFVSAGGAAALAEVGGRGAEAVAELLVEGGGLSPGDRAALKPLLR